MDTKQYHFIPMTQGGQSRARGWFAGPCNNNRQEMVAETRGGQGGCEH